MIAFHVATSATARALVVDPGRWPVEVRGVLPNGSSGYVEPRNTAGVVDLSGWVVSTCAWGAVAEFAVLPAGVELPPGGHLPLAGPDLAGAAADHVAVPVVDGDGHVLSDRRGAGVGSVAVSDSTDDNRAGLTCGAPIG